MRRATPPALPELSEPEVLRHYLHLSQETLGMMGVSLFGTCTMKYNPRLGEELAARPEIAELHPYQDDDTLQGVLEIVHGLDRDPARPLGDGPVRLPGRRRRPRRVHASPAIARAYHAARGELEQRDEVDHDDPGAPVQRGDRGGGRVQGRDAAARGRTATRRSTRCEAPSPSAPRR